MIKRLEKLRSDIDDAIVELEEIMNMSIDIENVEDLDEVIKEIDEIIDTLEEWETSEIIGYLVDNRERLVEVLKGIGEELKIETRDVVNMVRKATY